MDKNAFIDNLQQRIGQLFATVSPMGRDNPLRNLLQQSLADWELVSREDFEIHQQVLLRTREKLVALEKRVAELENAARATRAD
jgi:BMFP domain-containing protein YqiC